MKHDERWRQLTVWTWTGIGAAGTVFACRVWLRARDVDEARKRDGINGLFAIGCRALRAQANNGLAVQLLILGSGLISMARGPTWLVSLMLVAIAGLNTFASWWCEKKAEEGRAYIRNNPDPEPS